jgi:hypothetical protein
MNIFPTNLQYFIKKRHFENNKEIVLLYTDPNFSNVNLIGYYYPEKIIQKNIELNNYLFDEVVKCGNIRIMKWIIKNERLFSCYTFKDAAFYGNLENIEWLKLKK